MELTEKMLNSVVCVGDGGENRMVEVLVDVVEGVEFEQQPSLSSSLVETTDALRKVVGVRTRTNGVVAASQVVICLGPWSGEETFYIFYLGAFLIFH